jgi:cyclopropane fatty-acyl-phospholipid synthase-like methyltransferase
VEDLHAYLLARAGIEDGMRVLDAGCGVGGPSVYFARHRDVRIEALTISPVQADLARRRARDAGVDDRVRVTCGDYHELAQHFPPESFDVAVYLESFCHSHDPRLAIRSLAPVLKTGGVIYIKDYFLKTYPDLGAQRRTDAATRFSHDNFKTNFADSAYVKVCLEEAGFEEVWTEELRFTRDDSVWEEFARRHGFNPFRDGPPLDWFTFLELKFRKGS